MMLATCSRTAASSVMSSGTTSALPPLALDGARPSPPALSPCGRRTAPWRRRRPRSSPCRGPARARRRSAAPRGSSSKTDRPCACRACHFALGSILAYEGRHEISGGTHGEIGQGGDRDGLGDGAGRRVRGRPGGARLERRHQLHQEQEGSRRDLRDGQGQGRRGDPGAGRHGPGRRLPEARGRDPEEVGPRSTASSTTPAPPSSRTRATSTASRPRISTASCASTSPAPT